MTEKSISKLRDEKITIYEALQMIKDKVYVMPAFQRQYVWNMKQIEKLWDSILLDYPISTFLFWQVDETNTEEDTYFCSFLKEVIFDSRKAADSANYDLESLDTSTTNIAVLDGQQRLTSLYLSLFGEAYIRPNRARKKSGAKAYTKLLIELNKNQLELDSDEFNGKAYDIRFSDKIGKLSPTQFELKRIVAEEFRNEETREQAILKAIELVPKNSKEYAYDILNKLCEKVHEEKLIRYTLITKMNQDNALEMFVRFNSGGKTLKKAEITMSILEAYWPRAKEKFGQFLKEHYQGFSTDFIIRSALMLFGDVVKSNINQRFAIELKENWTEFKNALTHLEQTLKELKIDIEHYKNSWNVLLPILYYIYYNPSYNEHLKDIRIYLLRAVLFNYFQSGTTIKLQQMRSNINNFDYELCIDLLDQMTELRVTNSRIEDILSAEKDSHLASEFLYYISLDWMNKAYKYEVDHLHPYERFNENKPSKITLEEWSIWRGNRNKLPNLELLEGRSNGSKSDMSLLDYYNDMNEDQKALFKKQAFIPDTSLEFTNFGVFYEQRKALLEEKIKSLLTE